MYDCQQLRKKCVDVALTEISNNFSHLEYDSLPQTLQSELFEAKAERDRILGNSSTCINYVDEQKKMEQAFLFLPSERPDPEKKKKKKKRSKK